MSGAKGVRTKFQQDEKTQLFVDARSSARVAAAEARALPWLSKVCCTIMASISINGTLSMSKSFVLAS
jgi:hypothetical protein